MLHMAYYIPNNFILLHARMIAEFGKFSRCNLTRIAYYCNYSSGELFPSDNTTSLKNFPSIFCYSNSTNIADGQLPYRVPLYIFRAPTTLFISIVHLILCLVIALVLLSFFNSVKVLGKKSYTLSTSSIWWVLFYTSHASYHLALILFLPSYAHGQELPAYCLLTLLHALTYFFLCASLDHEWRFRTTTTSRLTVEPYSFVNNLKNILGYFVNWSRALFLCQTLVILSIAYTMPFRDYRILSILLLIYVLALLLLLCTVLAIGLAVICKSKSESKPRLPAKIILMISLIFQTTDIFPVYFINGFLLTDSVCTLRILTPHDLLSLFSILPLVFYLVFVMLEYKRVEAMNKYNIVSDLQALLQFQR